MTTERPDAPLVSVIIAAFNAGAYVSEAVTSALASRGVNVEVLVIDDESTDDTWSILESFGPAIRAVRQKKGGAYKARNLGARLARGEWLAFLDADDLWSPDKLARQLAVASAGMELVYTDCRNFGLTRLVKERQSDSTPLFDGEIFEPLLLNNFIALSSVLMRKRAFERLGGFSEVHAGIQDWDLWLRYAAGGGVVGLVREPLTSYRIHSGQMTQSLDARAAERVSVVERALASPRGQQVRSSVARRARANVWKIGAWVATATHRGKAIRWYLRAASYWPWNLGVYKEIAKVCLNRA